MRNSLESKHQKALIEWIGHNPKLSRFLIHIPNGGSRNKIEAFNLKLSGVRKGVPDLLLALPKNGYSGLWIELKAPKNSDVKPRLSKEQEEYLELLNSVGYKAVVCWGWIEARDCIVEYIGSVVPNTI